MLIFAHRGYAGRFPENTLLSFEKAIESGADYIELDITLSDDGQFVVIHDDTLNRTTNGKGFVGHHDSSVITQLDAGSWKNPRYAGQRVPMLSEVLALCAGRIKINIEIKPFFPLSHAQQMTTALVDLLRELEALNMLGDVLFSSINFYLLELLRELHNEIKIGLVYKKPMTDYDPLYVCERINAWSVHPYYRQIDAMFVQRLHAHGYKVIPFTVNRPTSFMTVNNYGVDGVFTDWPGRLKRWASAQ